MFTRYLSCATGGVYVVFRSPPNPLETGGGGLSLCPNPSKNPPLSACRRGALCGGGCACRGCWPASDARMRCDGVNGAPCGGAEGGGVLGAMEASCWRIFSACVSGRAGLASFAGLGANASANWGARLDELRYRRWARVSAAASWRVAQKTQISRGADG
jgi:hypothetical protein